MSGSILGERRGWQDARWRISYPGHVDDGVEVQRGQRCHLRDTSAKETDAQDQLLDAEREETFA